MSFDLPSIFPLQVHELLWDGSAKTAVLAKLRPGEGMTTVVAPDGTEHLSYAQTLYEELGELAMVQQMMRQQGSLYLAASLCESLEGAGHERAASSRFTLALRHYERALAPQLLAQAAVSPAMERCAAEARVELANFYLTRASDEVSAAGPGLASTGLGERIRLLEAALGHGKAGLAQQGAKEPPPPTTTSTTPSPPPPRPTEGSEDVRAQLAAAVQRALRELIKLHGAQGNHRRVAALKEEYRTMLQLQAAKS